MKIGIVVAMTREGVIGKNNQLPWRLPADLKRFREITTGHPIIMGRKTFDSIGRPLPGRLNIVISRNPTLSLPAGVAVASTYDKALIIARQTDPDRAFVIGGGEIFKQAFAVEAHTPVEDIFLTWVESSIEGDAYFPVELIEGFEVLTTQNFRAAASDQPPYSFVYLKRLREAAISQTKT